MRGHGDTTERAGGGVGLESPVCVTDRVDIDRHSKKRHTIIPNSE